MSVRISLSLTHKEFLFPLTWGQYFFRCPVSVQNYIYTLSICLFTAFLRLNFFSMSRVRPKLHIYTYCLLFTPCLGTEFFSMSLVHPNLNIYTYCSYKFTACLGTNFFRCSVSIQNYICTLTVCKFTACLETKFFSMSRVHPIRFCAWFNQRMFE